MALASGRNCNPQKTMETNRYLSYAQPELSAAFDRFATLREEMDRLFGSTFGSAVGTPASFQSWSPPLDVYEDKDSFTVVIDLPGLKKENIEISLREQNLTISGQRIAEERAGDQGFRAERFYGSFQRTVNLPAQVDPNRVKASYQDGILKVVLPKAETAKPKQIAVSAN
jgi:HSP20 family protein